VIPVTGGAQSELSISLALALALAFSVERLAQRAVALSVARAR